MKSRKSFLFIKNDSKNVLFYPSLRLTSKNLCYAQATWDQICLKKTKTKTKNKNKKTKQNKNKKQNKQKSKTKQNKKTKTKK